MAGLRTGPPPKPIALKRLQGNPAHEKIPTPDQELQPPKGQRCPRPPKWLGDQARAEWHRVAPWLFKHGLLTQMDTTALAIYCSALETYILASEDLAKNGTTISGARGEVRNPATATMKAAADTIRAFCGEFGLTPSSRARMVLPEDPHTESIDDILG